ncbi:efflux RND transporter periplasmic adaptor subunit [Kineococcus sp. SYSU DK001]|uniref:efflux RND transporter periplasmic adaptor subunit n=1 Tax=Kineococcus sp. SYSU DK001 TaxID=3383122 RepID=UPI003D7C7C1A
MPALLSVPRSPSRPSWLLCAAAGVAGVLVLAGCGGDEDAARIGLGTVGRGDVRQVVDAAGQVQPRNSAVLKAPAAGTVATLAVGDGQEVQAGQVLMTIDSPSAVQALEQAEAADAEAARSGSGKSSAQSSSQVAAQQRRAQRDAQARFAEAEAQAQAIADPAARAAALAAVQSSRTQYQLLASQTQALVDQVNSGLGNLDAAVESLNSAQRVQTRAAVAAARATVDALTVVAPISGRVSLGSGGGGGGSGLPAGAEQLLAGSGVSLPAAGAQDASAAGAPVLAQGAAVGQGATLVSVIDASTLTLSADVDETDVLLVQPGVVADVAVDAVEGARYRGTVTSVDPTAKSGAGGAVTYTVRLSYDGGTGADGQAAATPLPGMSAAVSLVVKSATDVVEVPASAIVRAGSVNGSADSDSVWVVRSGRAERQDVTVGVRGDADVEITAGLTGGERIVVEGAADVSQGQQVP